MVKNHATLRLKTQEIDEKIVVAWNINFSYCLDVSNWNSCLAKKNFSLKKIRAMVNDKKSGIFFLLQISITYIKTVWKIDISSNDNFFIYFLGFQTQWTQNIEISYCVLIINVLESFSLHYFHFTFVTNDKKMVNCLEKDNNIIKK